MKLLAEKKVLVTGATSGIGRVAAGELAALGARLVFMARNREKAEAARAWIVSETKNEEVSFIIADFSSLEQVRSAAREYLAHNGGPDVLVNNAGGLFLGRSESVDGFEMTFAVNHLAPFLLTNLLLESMRHSVPARIVNVSSAAHRGARIAFDDLDLKKGYGGMRAYSRSKLANLLFTFELARRLEGTGITVNALHPGFVATDFGKNNGGIARLFLPLAQRLGRARSPEEGARTTVYLASSPEVEGVSGKYFADSGEARPSPEALDTASMQRLWEVSCSLTGLTS
ncbi:MAG TPA: SDR family oxidoreductase [Spirochaetia bacterium]|nr:SDR family oxidoreductase [Spirochaetia bacterium]